MSIQLYTGDGKCKTMAALALALRALMVGMRVRYIVPHGRWYLNHAEIDALRVFGKGRFHMTHEIDIEDTDVVILDDPIESVARLIDTIEHVRERKIHMTLIMRRAPPEIIEAVDAVTQTSHVK